VSGSGYSNPCPSCGEPPFQPCRSLTRWKITDTHAERVRGVWPPWCGEHQQWRPRCEAFGKTHVIPHTPEANCD
jgi:hypothetical protein